MMRWRWAIVVACLAYACARFVVSGVYMPLRDANVGQVEGAAAPLQRALQTGDPVDFSRPNRYGPIFFLVMGPLLRRYGSEPSRLAFSLYALQLAGVSAGLIFTWRSIREWFAAPTHGRGGVIGGREALSLLVCLWLTFAPLYYIMSTKNVETWELGLLATGLYAYLRGWKSVAGLCVAAAALTKVLPFFFLLYFLIRDRRTFLYTLGWAAGIMSVTHMLYGPQVGLLYLPSIASAALGQTYALAWHENLSLKGLVIKVFGGWHVDRSYFTPLDATSLMIATAVGQVLQAAAVLWTGYLLFRGPGAIGDPSRRAAWEWALTIVMMLLVAPATAYEYMILALIAFSAVGALMLTDDRLRGDRRLVGLLVAALVLVGIVLPRQLFNRLLPLDWLNRMAGNMHLTPSEAYQAYGFPTLGLLCLAGVLWLVRADVAVTGRSEGALPP
jgi:hypothetical protein